MTTIIIYSLLAAFLIVVALIVTIACMVADSHDTHLEIWEDRDR